MAVPATVVAVCFLIAVITSLVLMAYVAWKGSKPSDFFSESVATIYPLELPEEEIDAYYAQKEKVRKQYAPESDTAEAGDVGESIGDIAEGERPLQDRWIVQVPPEERDSLRRALMKRLVASIDRLDKVQRDKPGNWKLWREKLVSERYWSSLCDAERLVSEEIDSCVAEAEELEPGWREVVFRQAVSHWRMGKQREQEKKVAKKAVEQQKKQKEKEVRAQEQEKKKVIEDKERQERLAEKMMEKLLREEENEMKTKKSGKDGGKAAKAKTDGKKKK